MAAASDKVTTIPARKKVKIHQDKHVATKYKAIATMKQRIFDMFNEFNMNRTEAREFLRSTEKTLGFEPQTEQRLRTVIEEQYQSLEQKKKRALIPLLTHRDDALNEDILQYLPLFRERSRRLLANPDRKERDDKIDLTFISDFMHEHCR